MLALHDRESAEDHHFEPISWRRDIIKTKHDRRRARKRRHKKFHQLVRGVGSSEPRNTDPEDQVDGQSMADGADDVPDVPIPVSDNPEMYLYQGGGDEGGEDVPLRDMRLYDDLDGEGEGEEEWKEPDVDSKQSDMPLSPKVVVKSSQKQTEV